MNRGISGHNSQESQQREREFFDRGARQLDPDEMPPREYSPYDSQFEDAILDVLPDLAGARVLDLGCGAGDLTLRMLDRGAAVTALDLSSALADVARERAYRYRPEANAEFVVASAEATGLPSNAFDLIVGKWVLHHTDLQRAAPEIHRLLRPGGRAVFVETSGLNPLLRALRRHLAGRCGVARYGTPDERPISTADIALLSREFDRCTIDFPNFVLFYLLERHVLRWRWRRAGAWCRAADRLIQERNPRLGRLSYYLRIQLQ